MHNISILEEMFKKFISNLNEYLPEGLQEVDIDLLHKHDLLNLTNKKAHPALTQYFHVIESQDKITLVNEQFIVWIVPDTVGEAACTYVLIALNSEEQPHLEVGFVTTGVYNTSKLVLRLLEKFLYDIQENEEILDQFNA